MSVRLYNTLSGKKEEFVPLREGRVGMYVCGITAYDVCHIGHARSAVVFDVITRYLRYRGYDVTYVKNYTDIDDKIIDKSNAEGLGISDIAERYIKEHDQDMTALGIIKPTVTPRATDYIEGMIQLIKGLFEKGLAYEMEGDVYYAVDRFKGYGKLSGRSLDEMMAGARVDINEKKKNPLDFALWKASKAGEPWWESPWGKGRPGWHIECSVMSQRFLGENFDIHGGGEDLIFPHHENEIAQSEGAYGKPLANYWLHNGFVRVNSEKMSKSLGNFFTIKDMLNNYHPEVLRFFMIQSHYRSPVDFSEDSLAEARQGLDRCYNTLQTMKSALHQRLDVSQMTEEDLTGNHRELFDRVAELPARFVEAMDDDFNTARAIGHVFDTIRHINGYLGEKNFKASQESFFVLDRGGKTIADIGAVFGLFLVDPDDYLREDRNREARKQGLDAEEIEQLIAARWAARNDKDWAKADDIRKSLASKKVILKDNPSGTTWTVQ